MYGIWQTNDVSLVCFKSTSNYIRAIASFIFVMGLINLTMPVGLVANLVSLLVMSRLRWV